MCASPLGYSEDAIEAYSARKSRAGVAVAMGSHIGQPLIIGIQFTKADPLDYNVCIGIEAVGCLGSGHMMSVSFAPFAGICFIDYENGFSMQTEALPSVHDISDGCAWIQVTEKGGMRFLRQFTEGRLEDTGLLPPALFPDWIQSYFGGIAFSPSDFAVEADISVVYSGCTFPTDMPILAKHGTEIQTTWSVLGEEIGNACEVAQLATLGGWM
jgi:hypothetical protein